ncbi:MAG: UDP-N-acetylmuramoyl-L-alanine--D-glutamate ligase [Deltaproteobacteria bacterium]|nr:UDP-N-acetylmuramoyl-L-alanine--D-glutamate ligase [Deltaproteobacteria bacterium]
MELSGKNVLVVGLARSGVAALRLLSAKGARLRVIDSASGDVLGERLEIAQSLAEEVAVGRSEPGWYTDADLIVVSPGVPLARPDFQRAADKGVPIVSEVELASWFIDIPIVGITGTNGKSTVTALVGHLLRSSGKRPFVGGNFGRPLSELPMTDETFDVAVVELSSFQLEAIDRMHPIAVAVTNLSFDHQDRYNDFASYVRAKKNVFRNMTGENTAVLNYDNTASRENLTDLPCRTRWFSVDSSDAQVRLLGDEIHIDADGSDLEIDVSGFPLHGRHNKENLLAAVALAQLAGAKTADMAEAIASFSGLPHRLERLGDVGGVRFVNDSKATSPDAVSTALESLDGPLILLLGGKDKGGNFRSLIELMEQKVKLVVTFGEASELIASQLTDLGHVVPTLTLEDAFATAVGEAKDGDTILLSPGCASQDAYTNFEHRGDHFRELAHAL